MKFILITKGQYSSYRATSLLQVPNKFSFRNRFKDFKVEYDYPEDPKNEFHFEANGVWIRRSNLQEEAVDRMIEDGWLPEKQSTNFHNENCFTAFINYAKAKYGVVEVPYYEINVDTL